MLPQGAYNPAETEKEILKYWLENKFYKPEFKSEDKLATSYSEGDVDIREAYTNVLPPPNANGNLHLGHMSGYAYQDLMGRFQRMMGKKVLLLPGKDHAGIQTEVVFEKILNEKGISKQEMGREEFYKQCFDFCMENSEIARNQEQNLGLSADYDRELFTLDPRIVDEVLKTFIDMFKDGLLYRKKRLINWCVRCQSALADIDTEYKDSEATFVYFKYAFPEPDEFAVKMKNKYGGKEIEAKIERYKGMKYKSERFGREYDWPFNYYGELEGEINPADDKNLDVLFVGFEDGLRSDTKVKGKAIGLMMRLDGDIKLIIKNETGSDYSDDQLKKDLTYLNEEYRKYFGGAHIILFDEYPEDKFYTNGFVIGTVRPETIFGDTGIAVNPKDERYKDYVGKSFDLVGPQGKVKLPIVADNHVDLEFGTGMLKVTPAHAIDDWDIASRNPVTLPEKQMLNFDGKMNHLTGKYEGMEAKKAREQMYEDMKADGFLVQKIDNYKNRKQICERCKYQIEPLISYQWFVDTKPLKDKAKQLVENGFTNIMPDGKKNVYLNWMDQPEDWCITRQLWWGYRVPVWYKQQPEEYITETGEVKEKIGDQIMNSLQVYKDYMKVQTENPGKTWVQDEDVLDTWFSSGQWPALTLIAGGEDFNEYYPTQVMETGWDILIFWVTRMMLLCPYKATKQLSITNDQKPSDAQITPFKNVYLHGLVLDKNGVKMSKSKGNGIDPFEMMQKYGTDALRLSFVVGNKAGQNYRLYEEKIESFRNYCNKIWNVSKFTLMNLGEDFDPNKFKKNNLPFTDEDNEMLSHIDTLATNSTTRMETFNFGVAAQELYESIWHTFADKYLEGIKPRIYTKDRDGNPLNTSEDAKKSRDAALFTLWYSLDKYLRLLHPFVPFITEKIWKSLPKIEGESETLMYARWPK